MRSGPRFVQLSDQFVDSLRAFFDSIDVDRTGFVSFENICQRWRRFSPRCARSLPPDFLGTLARTVPANGLVSFERFLAGVRIAIAEQRQGRRGEMKRVQSEGSNLHLEPSETHSPPLTALNQNRRSHGPMMGVQGGSPKERKPPPVYCPPSSSPKDVNENYKVQLRHKKNGHCGANGRDSRTSVGAAQFRPISSNSVSSNCSSSMAEIRWRDSRMSNTSTPLGDAQPTRHSSYLPEHSSQVAKHERLLEEEFEITRKGLETAHKLTEWYEQRIVTLDKRKEMLDKGMVALDSAVHEQKLNFIRAQVMEVNRRMLSLMTSSEKGFPSHQNMIRNAVPDCGGSQGASTCSTPDSLPAWLQSQNSRLAEELEAKTRLVEQLQREKQLFEMQNVRHAYAKTPNGREALYAPTYSKPTTPTAYVRPALVQGARMVPSSPVKVANTLL